MSQPAPSPKQRKRRRRARILAFIGYSLVALALAWFFELRLPTTIVIVRHAETTVVPAPETDPPLNDAGRVRAAALAEFVARINVSAGIDAVYADATLRTQQTAEPVAKRATKEVTVFADHHRYESFVRDILRDHRGEIVVVITQSDVVAPLLDELHGKKGIPEVGPADVYIVTRPWFGAVKTLLFPYGTAP